MTEAQTASTPALDQAVVLAKSQFEGWLKDNLDRDLNGRQRELLARVALEILYPVLRVAFLNDAADLAQETMPEIAAVFRATAVATLAEEVARGRARH